MKRYPLFMRLMAAVIAHLFVLEQLAFAAPLAPSKLDLFSKPKVDLGIPTSVAGIEDAWFGGEGWGMRDEKKRKTIYLIQDAHTNFSGQLNVARTLDHLFNSPLTPHVSSLKYVFLEAGSGDESLSFLRKYADLKDRQRLSESFLRQAKLQGSEYFDLTSDREFVLWGVEDLPLYAKSIEAYKEVVRDREKFQTYLQKVDTAIEALKSRIYNPMLLNFDNEVCRFQKEDLSLTDFFQVLTTQAQIHGLSLKNYPHLTKLEALKDKETNIDFKKASQEQAQAIQSLSEDDQKELLDLAQRKPSRLSGQDHKEDKAFYTLLEEKLKDQKTPELSKYFSYLKEAKALDPAQLLKEQKALESEIFSALAVHPDELNLVRSQKNLETLKKLLNLTLTPDEWQDYQKNKETFSIKSMTGFLNKKIMDLHTYYDRAVFLEDGYETIIQKAGEFYGLTYSRDQKFIENTLKKMDEENQTHAVLITGGFHSPNLKYLLKQQNISFVNLTPQVFQETNQARYEQILLGQMDKLQKFAQTPTLKSAGIPGTTGMDTRTGHGVGFAMEIKAPQPAIDALRQRDLAAARLAGGDFRDILGIPDRNRGYGPEVTVGGGQVLQGENIHGGQVKSVVGEKMVPETQLLSFTKLRGSNFDDSQRDLQDNVQRDVTGFKFTEDFRSVSDGLKSPTGLLDEPFADSLDQKQTVADFGQHDDRSHPVDLSVSQAVEQTGRGWFGADQMLQEDIGINEDRFPGREIGQIRHFSAEKRVVVDQNFGLTLGEMKSSSGAADRILRIKDERDFGMLRQPQLFNGPKHPTFIDGLQGLSHLDGSPFTSGKYTTPDASFQTTAARLAEVVGGDGFIRAGSDQISLKQSVADIVTALKDWQARQLIDPSLPIKKADAITIRIGVRAVYRNDGVKMAQVINSQSAAADGARLALSERSKSNGLADERRLLIVRKPGDQFWVYDRMTDKAIQVRVDKIGSDGRSIWLQFLESDVPVEDWSSIPADEVSIEEKVHLPTRIPADIYFDFDPGYNRSESVKIGFVDLPLGAIVLRAEVPDTLPASIKRELIEFEERRLGRFKQIYLGALRNYVLAPPHRKSALTGPVLSTLPKFIQSLLRNRIADPGFTLAWVEAEMGIALDTVPNLGPNHRASEISYAREIAEDILFPTAAARLSAGQAGLADFERFYTPAMIREFGSSPDEVDPFVRGELGEKTILLALFTKFLDERSILNIVPNYFVVPRSLARKIYDERKPFSEETRKAMEGARFFRDGIIKRFDRETTIRFLSKIVANDAAGDSEVSDMLAHIFSTFVKSDFSASLDAVASITDITYEGSNGRKESFSAAQVRGWLLDRLYVFYAFQRRPGLTLDADYPTTAEMNQFIEQWIAAGYETTHPKYAAAKSQTDIINWFKAQSEKAAMKMPASSFGARLSTRDPRPAIPESGLFRPSALEKGHVIANHILVAFHSAFLTSLLSLPPDKLFSTSDVLSFMFASHDTAISAVLWYAAFHANVWWHERGHYWAAVKTLTLKKSLLDKAQAVLKKGGFARLRWEVRMFFKAPYGKFPGISRSGLNYRPEAPYNLLQAAAGPQASGWLAYAALPLAFFILSVFRFLSFSEPMIYLGRLALGVGAVALLDRIFADPGKYKEWRDGEKKAREARTQVEAAKKGQGSWLGRASQIKQKMKETRPQAVVRPDAVEVKAPWGFRNSGMGGRHTEGEYAESNISLQESMFNPLSLSPVSERSSEVLSVENAQEMTVRLQNRLRVLLSAEGKRVMGVGLEGGLAPYVTPNEGDPVPELTLWRLMTQAIEDLGWMPGHNVTLSLDGAASELETAYREKEEGAQDGKSEAVGEYLFWRDKGQLMSRDALMALYRRALEEGIPIISFEDPFSEDDEEGWKQFNKEFGDNVWVVGDDLVTTNDKAVENAIDRGLMNALLVKANQIGTLTETISAMLVAMGLDVELIISHRSKKPNDDMEAHLALGTNAMGLKSGGGSNTERLVVYNSVAKLLREAAERRSQSRSAAQKNDFFAQAVIAKVTAIEEPTNAGIPTVGVTITLQVPGTNNRREFTGAAPLGTSAGTGEAVHLVDSIIEKSQLVEKYPELFSLQKDGTYQFTKNLNNKDIYSKSDEALVKLWEQNRRYAGKGTQNAARNVEKIIAPFLIGKKAAEIGNLRDFDRQLLELEFETANARGKDNTKPVDVMQKKANLGMNAILPVSLALARLKAASEGKELYDVIREEVMRTMRSIIEEHDQKEPRADLSLDRLKIEFQRVVKYHKSQNQQIYPIIRRHLGIYETPPARRPLPPSAARLAAAQQVSVQSQPIGLTKKREKDYAEALEAYDPWMTRKTKQAMLYSRTLAKARDELLMDLMTGWEKIPGNKKRLKKEMLDYVDVGFREIILRRVKISPALTAQESGRILNDANTVYQRTANAALEESLLSQVKDPSAAARLTKQRLLGTIDGILRHLSEDVSVEASIRSHLSRAQGYLHHVSYAHDLLSRQVLALRRIDRHDLADDLDRDLRAFTSGARLAGVEGLFRIPGSELMGGAKRFLEEIQKRGTADSGLADYRSDIPIPTGREKGVFLYVDWGGTNLRIGGIELNGNRTYKVLPEWNPKRDASLLWSDELKKSGKAMVAFVAEKIVAYAKANLDPKQKYFLGFSFAFSSDRSDGIRSARVVRDTSVKGFDFSDLLGAREVGEDIVERLQAELNLLGSGNIEITAVINDTESTRLVSEFLYPDTIAGGIFGTGHNVSIRSADGRSVNLEMARTSRFERNDLDMVLDGYSSNPGKQPLEKAMSGKYLGPLMGITLTRLIREEGLFNGRTSPVIEARNFESNQYSGVRTEQLSEIAAWDLEIDNGRLRAGRWIHDNWGIENATLEDLGIVYRHADAIVTRSAQLAAQNFAAIVMDKENTDTPRNHHVYAVDGSLLFYPDYTEKIRTTLKAIFDPRYVDSKLEISEVSDGSGIGAALTAGVIASHFAARLALPASETKPTRDVLEFALEAYDATSRTGFIQVDEFSLGIEVLSDQEGRETLSISGLGNEVIRIDNFKLTLQEIRGKKAPSLTLSLSELRQKISAGSSAGGSLWSETADLRGQSRVVQTIDLSPFEGNSNFDTGIAPLLIQEATNIYSEHPDSVRFVVRGPAKLVRRFIKQVHRRFSEEQQVFFSNRAFLPPIFQNKDTKFVTLTSAVTPLIQAGDRHLYLKDLSDTDVLNAGDVLKLNILEAFIEPESSLFEKFLSAFESAGGVVGDRGRFFVVMTGRIQGIDLLLYALQPRPVDRESAYRLYALMIKMAAQAA